MIRKKMTPEEAIKVFESELERAELNTYPYVSKQKIEADKIAIEAIKQKSVLEIKTVTNAEEAEVYPISENITKGFEEFTKMIFKQGQTEIRYCKDCKWQKER